MKFVKKYAKSLVRKAKNLMREIKKIIINQKKASFYARKGKSLLEKGNKDGAKRVFEKGLKFYPNSILIHKELANHAMDEEKWNIAVYHWNFLLYPKDLKKRKEITPKIYIHSSRALKLDKQLNESINVLNSGLKKYPLHEKLILELSKRYRQQKEWGKVSDLLIQLFEVEGKQPSDKVHMDLSDAYTEQGLYNKAEYILRNWIKNDPEHKKILNSYAHIAIQRKDWQTAIQRLEYLCKLYVKKIPFNTSIKLSMLYQIIGNSEKSKAIFNPLLKEYPQKIDGDVKGYRKIVLYDNGESRIEFYKNLKETAKVVLTFDSINMVWERPSFGFKLLLRQGVDIIALRKREQKTYHQDLSKNNYLDSVNTLVKGYEDKIAYGFSLGAYSALYYASHLNCRILALAPRLSIHPTYGKRDIIPMYDFKHTLSNDYNKGISPIIVYDPKDKLDNTYVQNELIQSFPNAQLVKIPYGGHLIAPHLLRMGVLKGFILSVIDGEVPKYDRRLKSNSANYCRILGHKCLKHNKIRWANHLSNRAVRLLPTDNRVIKFRVEVLKRLNQYYDAIEFVKNSIELVPNSLGLRFTLIDLYIQTKNLITAERELKLAKKRFESANGFSKREKKLDQEREKVINTPLNIFGN